MPVTTSPPQVRYHLPTLGSLWAHLPSAGKKRLTRGWTVTALAYPPSLDIQWAFFVKHHTDPEVAARSLLLTWTLPDGTYWVGPKSKAPAGAELNGL